MKMGKTLIALAAAIGWAAVAQASGDTCKYQGSSFSDGATTCQSGTQFRCDDGDWKSLAVACPAKEGRCEFGGTSYSEGASSCQSGVQYRCDGGAWKSLSVVCGPDQAAAPRAVVPAQPLRTCMLEGSTVSHASTVCKSGTMYECDDGDWRNLGTPCK